LVFTLRFQAHAENSDALISAHSIELGGVEGRIDHLAVDARNNRLYVAALGNNTVEVIDLMSGKRVAQIKGLSKPQGVAVLPETGAVVVASGDDGKCRFYDKGQKLLGVIDGLDDADNVRYDPTTKLVYVGYGDGALAAIDPRKFQKLADIKLEGHPESFQLEQKGKRIFVNVPNARQIAVVDRQTQAVVARWPVDQVGGNFPMALDEARHRLFVGCRQPAKLLVLDTESGKTLTSVDCAGDTDDVWVDRALKRAYVSGGEGFVTVIGWSGADQYKAIARVATAAGARTSFLAADDGSLYVAIPHRGAQKAELRVFKTR
jgi:YVTN family beta-propeller protein